MSISPKSQRHGGAVKPGNVVTVNLDYKQMGLGGDTSWGKRAMPHPEYRLPAQAYFYKFRLRPFDSSEESPFILSKQIFPINNNDYKIETFK